MTTEILGFVKWKDFEIKTHAATYQLEQSEISLIPATLYKNVACNYVKFFKMDMASQVAFLGAELLSDQFAKIDKLHTAVVLQTFSGSYEVDRKFDASRNEIASPALFVYTLPNIMAAEISIRHQLKGEQFCTIAPQMQPDFLGNYCDDLLQNRNITQVLTGFVEATAQHIECTMALITGTKNANTESTTVELLKNLA